MNAFQIKQHKIQTNINEERKALVDSTKNTIAPVQFIPYLGDELLETVTCLGIRFYRLRYHDAYYNDTFVTGKSCIVSLPRYNYKFYKVTLLIGVNREIYDAKEFESRYDAFEFAAEFMKG